MIKKLKKWEEPEENKIVEVVLRIKDARTGRIECIKKLTEREFLNIEQEIVKAYNRGHSSTP